MFKSGWILLILVAILATSISCACQTDSKNVDVPETSAVLAPSPMETTDGSLVGDGWHYGQTPQSYNTGPNQKPASEEEVQRVKDALEEEMEDWMSAEEVSN